VEHFLHLMENVSTQIVLASIKATSLMSLSKKYRKGNQLYDNMVQMLIGDKVNRGKDQKYISNDIDSDDPNDVKKCKNIFIDQAIDLYDKNQFTWKDIVAESKTIVAASFETTAVGMFSTIVFLAMHPEVQERLFDEIKTAFPEKDFEMQYEDMKDLTYLSMVINEVLRLTPSVPLIARYVDEDLKINEDLILPKGVEIVISIFSLHRRKDLWGENANQFDPERFSPENITKIHPHAYIPFSKGVRNCIGWRYALFALKIGIASLVRNFRFETDMKFDDLSFVENISIKYAVEPKIKLFQRV